MLALTLYQLGQLYRQELPELVAAAEASGDAVQFRRRLGEWVSRSESAQGDAGEQIRLLIDYDGREVDELSTGERMPVRTLTLLWQFLTGCLENVEMRTDLFIDLFYLFKRLGGAELPPLSMQRVRIRSERWSSGLDAEVREIRADNRERMLHLLVQKIENRKSTPSRFRFAEGMSYEDKYRQVAIWWNDFRFHLAMAVKSPSELNRFLGNSLSAETMYLLSKARKKGMPFFATPYYLSLLDVTGKGYGDEAIRSYILYSPQLVETYGSIRAWEKEDVVEAGKPNAAGWLLPDGHNIHRRYPEVAILIPDTMGRACGGLCASCQRMYDFQSERLNFEFESLRPKESWDHKLRRLMTYFEEDTQLRDILITGGDALMSQNKTLHNILEAVYRMACRKRKANAGRPDGEKYAELQRVRLGSRLPAYLPMRIDDGLVEVLREFKQKASAVGVRQFIIQTHFQSPLEVTPEAQEAIRRILAAGWLVTNQLVYTVAASRRGHTTRLRQVLNALGVVCYYTFSVKGFQENYAVFTPNSRVDEFVDAIRDAKQNMHFCSVCFNLSSQDPCPICSDISRDRSTICVVETPQDVQAIERSGDYHGLYHVLHGALSPLDGVNVEDLRIRELLQRLGNTTVKEVILATDPDVEGEATALYLARLIKTAGIRVTRIARGLPMGGDIEYADEATLAGAVANRQEM